MPVIDLNKVKIQEETLKWKVKKFAEKTKKKISNSIRWVKDNPTEATMLLTGATGLMAGVNKVTKTFNRYVTARKERFTKERYIYDHSLNVYLKTKRRLTQNDVKRINTERRKTGERLSEVLARMNLLE